MEFIHNLRDFLLKFDTYILDIYKTIENDQGRFIEGVMENIRFLAEHKKNIILFTNYPLTNKHCFNSHEHKLLKSLGVKQYTSGEICFQLLQQKYSTYFLFGARSLPVLQQVDDINLADVIFLDLPALPKKYLTADRLIKSDRFPNVLFSEDVKVFEPFLHELKQKDKVLYSGKPLITDYLNVEDHEVISDKQIVDKYKELGGKVIEIGKPYVEAYEFFISSDSNKILCVGDTMETDILGALNLKKEGYKTSSLLVLTGETSLDDLEKYTYKPDFVISSLGC